VKGARDRRPAGGEPRERTGQLLDRDTQKISASQLAEVLARVDGEVEARVAGELESKPPEPRRTISGTRPIIRPAIRPRSDTDAPSPRPSEPAGGIDIPVAHLAPIIERPVPEEHVVNATVLVAREPSEQEVEAASGPTPVTDVLVTLPSEPSGMVPAASAPLQRTNSVEIEMPSAEPVVPVRRTRLAMLVFVMLVLASVAALVLAYRR
jgi:hypothetical protein